MDVKFRAWDNIENGWVDEDWIRQNAGAWLLGEIPKEITLQQYAGVQDKTGRDIYEGDIVFVNGVHRAVEWRTSGFYCTMSDCPLNTVWFLAGEPKVVGNKFEGYFP